MITVGVDSGSRALKVVVYDAAAGSVLASEALDQGVDQAARARRLFEKAIERCRLRPRDVECVVATGYGRNQVDFADKTITEITCHSHGVRRLTPDARSIIDIGGQDSKFIRLDESGRVEDFAMNDRCAAGTGRFLEKVADWLEIDLTALGNLAASSRNPSSVSSMCVVFAETEIIGLLAAGVAPEDIVAGVQRAMASRIASMAGRRAPEPLVFTGGVARVPGMAAALELALGRPVRLSPEPQFTGALGAAILAANNK